MLRVLSCPLRALLTLLAAIPLLHTALLPSKTFGQNSVTEPRVVSAPRFIGKLEAFDDEFYSVVAADARIEVLAEGFAWTEGPVWSAAHRALLFSDIPRNTIFQWSSDRGLSVFLRPAGYTEEADGGYKPDNRFRSEPGTNGLALDPQGRLAMCEHGNRRVSVLIREYDSIKQTLAASFQGRRLNSPNDLVFARNGDLYFTDPPYGRPQRFDDPGRELDFCGVFRVSAQTGQVHLVTKELKAPNGIALSPDGKILYVAQSDGQEPIWKAFDVQPDGSVTGSRVFQDARKWIGTYPGGCDGMKVDQAGRLFATGPGGVYIITPDGRVLGRILTGVATANCAFGEDGSVLYLAANDLLCRISTKSLGLGF